MVSQPSNYNHWKRTDSNDSQQQRQQFQIPHQPEIQQPNLAEELADDRQQQLDTQEQQESQDQQQLPREHLQQEQYI